MRSLAISALVATLASGAVQAAEPLTLNVILSLSGFGSLAGREEQKAFGVAEMAINRQGGIWGRPVHFAFYDDQTTPQVAVQLATQAIASRPTIFLGPNLAATCNAIAPLLKNGPVMYCLSPAIQTTPGSMVFSASIPTDDLLETVIRYFHGRGWNRLALLTTTDASGQDAERAFQRVLAMPEFAKMRIVAHDRFNASDISVAAQIERLRQAKPQALLAWTTGTAVGTIFRGLKQADYDLPVATSTGNELMSLINQFADEMPRELYFASGQGSARDVPGQDAATTSRDMAFLTTFREAGLTPDQAAETVWDASMIVSDALRHAGPEADAARVRDAIDQMSGYVGVDGTYDFVSHPQRGLPPDVAVMVRWDSAKKEFVAVSPPGG